MDNTEKEYISELFGRVPMLEDYKNKKGVDDPDAKSREEYADFRRLVIKNCTEGGGGIHKGVNMRFPDGSELVDVTEPSKLNGSWEIELKIQNNVGDKEPCSIRLGGDQVVTGWLQSVKNTVNPWATIGKYMEDEKDLINEAFIRARYSPGNFIFWPRYSRFIPTINQALGQYFIRDRHDLALEYLHRWYEKKDMPVCLKYVFDYNKRFFDLFKNFDGFSSFFHLNEGKGANKSAFSFVKNGEVINLFSGKAFKDEELLNDLGNNFATLDITTHNNPFPNINEYEEGKKQYKKYLENSIAAIHARMEKLAPFLSSCEHCGAEGSFRKLPRWDKILCDKCMVASKS